MNRKWTPLGAIAVVLAVAAAVVFVIEALTGWHR